MWFKIIPGSVEWIHRLAGYVEKPNFKVPLKSQENLRDLVRSTHEFMAGILKIKSPNTKGLSSSHNGNLENQLYTFILGSFIMCANNRIGYFLHYLQCNIWGCVYSAYQFLLWWLWEYVKIILFSTSNRKYDHLPLFRIRQWNNGMRCMSFYILILQLHHVLRQYEILCSIREDLDFRDFNCWAQGTEVCDYEITGILIRLIHNIKISQLPTCWRANDSVYMQRLD